ncbi:MAG: hypothetical protein A4E72_00176 [Syntrophus sp. PtaU1.Bin208]|nr:MAG: hypothetical protein A4E72_00176 [Syntrophus sp. PtaU1.Bin208]
MLDGKEKAEVVADKVLSGKSGRVCRSQVADLVDDIGIFDFPLGKFDLFAGAFRFCGAQLDLVHDRLLQGEAELSSGEVYIHLAFSPFFDPSKQHKEADRGKQQEGGDDHKQAERFLLFNGKAL